MKQQDIAVHLEEAADALPDLVFNTKGELVSGKPSAAVRKRDGDDGEPDDSEPGAPTRP